MTNIETVVGVILSILSIALLIKMCKGRSCDYKTRIRVYEAIYAKEICFVDTKHSEVVKYVEDTCKEYPDYKKKDFKIVIKYMSKLTYSLMREI
jgi:hypothetical protein